MDFDSSTEERAMISTVRRFVETELQPLEAEVEASGELSPDRAAAIFNKSRDLGLYAMNMPTELGGGGLNALQTCLVEEQTGRTMDILIRRTHSRTSIISPIAYKQRTSD